MDTITLAGPLEGKLQAMREAGFTQAMLCAADIVAHPGGVLSAVRAVRESGLRVTGLQVLRDFEGLSGQLHDYKVEVAKSMLELCDALDCRLLLACSSTSRHAGADKALIARDLRKLAMLALPSGIRIAYEALSWGRVIHEFTHAWDVVAQADCPNLGIALDSYHILASGTPADALELLDPRMIFLVQLSDFLWNEVRTLEERIATARHLRVFPGEGVHSEALASIVSRLDRLGYRGDYSFEVFNDDYQQMPPGAVAARAGRSAIWLADEVLKRQVPLPNSIRLQHGRGRAAAG